MSEDEQRKLMTDILNECLNDALFSPDRIIYPDSNKVALFVDQFIEKHFGKSDKKPNLKIIN